MTSIKAYPSQRGVKVRLGFLRGDVEIPTYNYLPIILHTPSFHKCKDVGNTDTEHTKTGTKSKLCPCTCTPVRKGFNITATITWKAETHK